VSHSATTFVAAINMATSARKQPHTGGDVARGLIITPLQTQRQPLLPLVRWTLAMGNVPITGICKEKGQNIILPLNLV